MPTGDVRCTAVCRRRRKMTFLLGGALATPEL